MNRKHMSGVRLLPHLALFSEVTIAIEDGCEHSQSGGARLALIVLHPQQPAHHQLNTLDLVREREGGSERGRRS